VGAGIDESLRKTTMTSRIFQSMAAVICLSTMLKPAQSEGRFARNPTEVGGEMKLRMALFVLAAGLTGVMALPAQSQCSNSSNCQIIVSGTGLPASPAQCTPWGLWVWSQPANNNYGNDGQGDMYFYQLDHGQASVEASDVVFNLSDKSITETVTGAFNPDGKQVSCVLAAHQTSPGKGILDSMSCTVGKVSCAVSDVPITFDLSSAN
jgi:hypothetical protein